MAPLLKLAGANSATCVAEVAPATIEAAAMSAKQANAELHIELDDA